MMMNLFKLISVQVFILKICISANALPANYTSPILNLGSKFNFDASLGQLVNSPGTTYSQIKATDFYVSRLSSEGKVEIYDASSKSLQFYLFGSTSKPLTNKVLIFDLPDRYNASFTGVLDDRESYSYDLYENGSLTNFVASVSSGTAYKVNCQLMRDELVLLVYDGTKTYLNRRLKSNSWKYTYGFTTNFSTPTFNMKVCKNLENDTFFRVAIWKRNCYVQILSCPFNGGCSSIYFVNNTGCNYGTQYDSQVRDQFKLEWSLDCSKVMYEWKNEGIKVVDILSNTTIKTCNLTGTGLLGINPLYGFWFLDDYDQYMGVLTTASKFDVYKISQGGQKMSESILGEQVNLASYSKARKMLYISSGLHIYGYSLGCNDSSYAIQSGGICQPAPINTNGTFNVSVSAQTPQNNNSGINVTSNSSTNSTHTNSSDNSNINHSNVTNNTQNNHSANNSVNSSSNGTQINSSSTLNQTNPSGSSNSSNSSSNSSNSSQTTTNNTNKTESPVPQNQSIFSDPSSPYQSQEQQIIAQNIKTVFQQLGSVLSVSFALINNLPVAFLFIKYVNFWSICTMYLFLDIPFPSFLTQVLTSIYSYMNISLFKALGLNFRLQTGLNQKFNEKDVNNFGFSSDLLNFNLENTTFLIISYSILWLVYLSATILPKDCFLKGILLKINYPIVISAQYISMMSSYFFNLPIISEKSFQPNFPQKINMALQNTFFIFSAFVSVLIVLLIDNLSKEKISIELKTKRSDWQFDSQCNALFPLIAILRNLPLFLALNTLFFCFPIFATLKQESKSRRVISIMKSLYLQIFNLGAAILCLSKFTEIPTISKYLGLIMLIVFFIGALHEILELMIGWLYNMVVFFCSRKDRVVSAPECDKENQGQVSKIVERKAFQKLVTKKICLRKNILRLSKAFNNDFQTDLSSIDQTISINQERVFEIKETIKSRFKNSTKPVRFSYRDSKEKMSLQKAIKIPAVIQSKTNDNKQKSGFYERKSFEAAIINQLNQLDLPGQEAIAEVQSSQEEPQSISEVK